MTRQCESERLCSPHGLNPFVWDRPLADRSKIVGTDDFARDVALVLKAQTNVAIFGARDTGKSTFLTALEQELALEQEADAPAHAPRSSTANCARFAASATTSSSSSTSSSG